MNRQKIFDLIQSKFDNIDMLDFINDLLNTIVLDIGIMNDLIEEKEYSANTGSKVRINEPIKIDYNRYNDIINRFLDVYDLYNSNSTVTIKMFVNITQLQS